MSQKLFYLSANRFPDYRATSVQQMQMCSGFESVGLSVELISRQYIDPYDIGLGQDIWKYYGIERPFTIHLLPSLQADNLSLAPRYSSLPFIGGSTANLFFASFWGRHLLLQRKQMKQSIVYGREIRMIYLAQRLQQMVNTQIPVYFEAHRNLSHISWSYFAMTHLNGIISITHALKDHLTQTYNIDPDYILVEPDAVAIEPFKIEHEEIDAERCLLNLPQYPTKLIGFSGNLYPGRGGEELIRAFALIRGDTHLLIVGGQLNDLNRLKILAREIGIADRITFTGHLAPAIVPHYIRICDVLVAPYTAQFDTAPYTSPMKIFEYMASHKPMVVTRLPVLEEVLEDGRNSLLVALGDVEAFANGIQQILNEPELAEKLAEAAYKDVQRYTWHSRAKRIKEFIQSTAGNHIPLKREG